jgi:hypothetical protein
MNELNAQKFFTAVHYCNPDRLLVCGVVDTLLGPDFETGINTALIKKLGELSDNGYRVALVSSYPQASQNSLCELQQFLDMDFDEGKLDESLDVLRFGHVYEIQHFAHAPVKAVIHSYSLADVITAELYLGPNDDIGQAMARSAVPPAGHMPESWAARSHFAALGR